ncbi:MAG TPA: ABC transporter permease [candidate division Zixibacteria bacterium]|nr:ABC transporter permease [candidate division Zixibacteria bacterium]
MNWSGWLVFLAAVLAWEAAGRSRPELSFYVPPATEIASALAALVLSGEAAGHLAITLLRLAAGYLLAAVLAVSAGIVLGYFRWAHSLMEPVIEFLRPMPSVAIIPVAILALGIGDAMIVAVTVYASAWPILINTIDGVRNIDPTLIQTGRTFGLNRWRILSRIAVPAASPYVMTGLRISLAVALILVTTAEMLAGGKGLGFFILDEERSLRNANMYAGIAVTAALGYALNRGFALLEKRVMRWHHGAGAREAV